MDTDAAIIDCYGNVVGFVSTAQLAGKVRYYCQATVDGTPVNTQVGKISRSKKNLHLAATMRDPCGYYLTKNVNSYEAE